MQRLGYRNQGATWIKPQEIAARDKLIKQFEVAPVLGVCARSCALRVCDLIYLCDTSMDTYIHIYICIYMDIYVYTRTHT
jgi:hypothetical protein